MVARADRPYVTECKRISVAEQGAVTMSHITAGERPEAPARRRISGVVWTTAAGWLGISVIAVVLAGGTLPFDRPALTGTPVTTQVLAATGGLLGVVLLL